MNQAGFATVIHALNNKKYFQALFIWLTNPHPRAHSAPELRLAHLSRVGIRISPRYSSDARLLASPSVSAHISLPTCSIPVLLPINNKKDSKRSLFCY